MLFDTHCHLSLLDGGARDLERIVGDARDAGVGAIVDISVGIEGFITRRTLARSLAAACGVDVYMTCGIPPFHAGRRRPGDVDELERQAGSEGRVRALGEMGLDYHHTWGSREEQIALFSEQIDLANRLGLPVVVHSRDADDDLLSVLEAVRPARGGILHCFSSGRETAGKLLDLGFCLSFAGNVTYPKSTSVREAAVFAPSDRYLVETDAPYLAPGRFRGGENRPAYLEVTARFLAELRKVPFEVLSEQTTANAARAFGVGIPRER